MSLLEPAETVEGDSRFVLQHRSPKCVDNDCWNDRILKLATSCC